MRVLDMCCGTRAWWIDKQCDTAVFGDIRAEVLDLRGSGWERTLTIKPDVLFDFRRLPFADQSFWMVVFDPPHMIRVGSKRGFIRHRYGELTPNWRQDLREGFAEAFRVLRPNGTLIFKWNEIGIKLSEVLALTDRKPTVAQRRTAEGRTHWVVFLKDDA